MALTEFETEHAVAFLDAFIARRRPPEELRGELDLGYRIDDQSVEIFEIRTSPRDLSQKIESPVARATYIRTQDIWKVFWRRADSKWHNYRPKPSVRHLDEFTQLVEEDEDGCFWR